MYTMVAIRKSVGCDNSFALHLFIVQHVMDSRIIGVRVS